MFDRTGAPEPCYTVVIYLPEARRWTGTLRWVDGRAELEADPGVDSEGRDGILAEALKLARVLHRDPRQHMVRWRG